MPLQLEERVAVLETQQNRNASDLQALFTYMREHADKDEVINKQTMTLIGEINGKLDKQKSFWAGMLFTFTGIASVIASAVTYFKTGG